jgi:F-type H+-transporting ATPase subunit b
MGQAPTNLAAAASNPLLPNGTFFAELIIFVIVLVVMWRFVVPPIAQVLRERSERLAKTAEERQEAMRKLADADKRYNDALADARRKAGDIRGEARVEGQHTVDELRTQVQTEVDATRQRTEADLAEQRQRALRELQGDIGSLSTALAGRIVGADLPSGGRQSATVAAFLDGLATRGDGDGR